jgi:hypothetical protein
VNKTKRRRLTIFLIIFLLFGYFGVKGWQLFRITQSLQTTRAEFDTLTASGVTNADPAAMSQLLYDVRADVVDLKRTTRTLVWFAPAFGWLPRVGPLLREARPYLQLADAGSRVGEQLAPTVEAGLRTLQQGGDPISAAAKTLADATATLQAIESDVVTIQTIWLGLESKAALPWAVRQFVPQLDTYMPSADQAVQAAQILPALSGVDGDKQYLMLIQNDDERRATGGFVSSVGTVHVANGALVSLDFRSSDYDIYWLLDNSERFDWPPEPLTRYMNLQYLLYRDANYWPNFPTSAEKILELYKIEYPESPDYDGLIAIDQQFVSILLSGTGPIYVPELDQVVDSNNVIAVMRSAWNPPEDVTGEWFVDRKSFVGDVAKAIQEHILTDPTDLDVLGTGHAVLEAFEMRHLQLYVTDPTVATELGELGWDGHAVQSTTHDYLLVVDTNMGFNKANGAVEREIDYSADLETLEANLAIRYHHTAAERTEPCEPIIPYSGQLRYRDMLGACLYNFVRVYPAAGSSLVDGSIHPTPAELTITGEAFDGRPFVIDESPAHFGNFFIVNPATILLNTYSYRLPESVMQNGVYQLLLQKQAGAGMERATVHVTVPTGAKILSTTPDAAVDGTTATFDLPFDRDVTIEVTYK